MSLQTNNRVQVSTLAYLRLQIIFGGSEWSLVFLGFLWQISTPLQFQLEHLRILLVRNVRTSFPVGTCLASLTLAKFPLPMVLSSLYLPMWGSSEVRLLELETLPAVVLSLPCNKYKER